MPRKDRKNQNAQPKNNRPELTPEQRKERARNRYLTDLTKLEEMSKNRFEALGKVYGPSGEMPSRMSGKDEYDEIYIPVPSGMNDFFVTAVALGSMMDPARLDREMTTSGFIAGSTTYIAFNQNFLVENITGNDQRYGDFAPVMLQGRNEAKQAVIELIGKKSEKAYEYMNRFIQYAASNVRDIYPTTSSDLLKDSEFKGPRSAIRLAVELMEKEPYKSHVTVSDYDRMKLQAYVKQADIKDQIIAEKAALMKNPPAAGSPEREAAVAEIMFKEYLLGTLSNSTSEKDNYENQILTELTDQQGVDNHAEEYSALFGTPLSISTIRMPLKNSVTNDRTTDREVILSRPDGVETLRSMYMDSIRKTGTFRDLVSAEGPAFQDQMMELDRTASDGFQAFPEVKTHGEADPFNQLSEEAHQKGIQATAQTIGEMADRYYRRKNRITTYDAKSLSRNRQNVEDAIEDFTNRVIELQKSKQPGPAKENEQILMDALKDNEILLDVYTDLKSLSNQALSMEKAGKASQDNLQSYTATIDQLTKGIESFLTERGNSAPEAEQPMFCMLRRVSRNLKWNKYGVMEPERIRERDEIIRQNGGSYEKASPEGIDAMAEIRKEQYEIGKIGVSASQKEVITRAETATMELAKMVKAGTALEGEAKDTALGYLKDILAERLYARGVKEIEKTYFPERYAASVVEKTPEFRKLQENLTLTDIGQIAFEGRADQMTAGYTGVQVSKLFIDEKTLATRAVTDRINREEEQRKADEEEARRQEVRDKYRRDAAERKADYQDPLKLFHKFYGSKPSMDPGFRLHEDYNELRVENLPEGIDENTFTAIVIGSIMKKERLDQRMTSSSFQGGTTTFLDFNRNFLIDNIISVHPDVERQGSFALALVEGRKDALQAIQEYQNGHPERAKEMLGTFIDFASNGLVDDTSPTSSNMIQASRSTVGKTLFQLGGEMIGKPPFFAEGNQTEVRKIHAAANEQTMKAMNRVYETKHGILTQPKPAGSQERINEIENLLFDQYLMSTLFNTSVEKDAVGNAWSRKLMEKYGLDDSYDPNTYVEVVENMAEVDTQQRLNGRENLLTDHEVMMSTDQGIESLKALYLPEIRKTKLYQDLIQAKGVQYEDLLRESDDLTRFGLQSLQDVTLPSVARPINEKNRKALEKRNKELEAMTDEIAVKAAREAQNFDGYDQDSMANNAEHLKYLTDMMNRDIMSDKSLPKPAKTAIADLKKAVKTYTTYASELAKKEDITISDMLLYETYAQNIENVVNGYVVGSQVPSDGPEKQVFLAIRRVGFMTKVNMELVTGPARIEERELRMADAMKKQSDQRLMAMRTKHPGMDEESADFRYGVLSDDGLKDLNNSVQETLRDSRYGTSRGRKEMIHRARYAVKDLTQMIGKGEEYIREHQEEAKELLKDVFAERLLARFDKNRVPTQEPENYFKRFTEKFPPFTDLTKNITIGTIGTFIFEKQGDKIIDQFKQADMTRMLDELYLAKRTADLKEIERREKLAEEKKKNQKNEIIEENQNVIHEGPVNEIAEENLNVIHEGPVNEIVEENLNVIHEGPVNPEAKLTEDSADKEKHIQKKDLEPDAGKKKSKKRAVQKEEEPQDEPKQEPKEEPIQQIKNLSDQLNKEEPLQTIKNSVAGVDKQPPVREEPKIVEEEINTDSKNPEGSEVDMNNLIREDATSLDLTGIEDGMDEFIKVTHLFSRTRQNVIDAMKEDLRPFVGVNPINLHGKDKLMLKAINDCGLIMENKKQSPQIMWNNLKDLALEMAHLDPSKATKYRLMTDIFGEAVKPLTTLKSVYEPLESKNAANASVNDIYKAVDNVKRDYNLESPTIGTVKAAYAALEADAKAKFLLKDSLTKACGMDIDTSPVYHDPDEVLVEIDEPANVHEAASRCVAKIFLAKANAEKTTPEEINGMTALVKNGSFEAQVKDLEKNPIFRKVAAKYPERYYSRWQKVLNRAAEQKQKANAVLNQLQDAGALGGLADYVAHGSHGDLMIAPAEQPQNRMAQNARLAQVLANKLLADPKLITLRQAVGAGVIKPQDIAVEAMDFVERKNIRVMDPNGQLNHDFARKLENGDLQKNLIKSEARFLAKAKNRDAEQKKEIQKKLNAAKMPKAKESLLGSL